jgi:thiol:disulfide interchange protein
MRRVLTAMMAIFAIANLLALTTGNPADAKRHHIQQVAYGEGQSVQWFGDLDSAFTQAKVDNKPVLVIIAANWCPHCQSLERNIIPQATVQDFLKNNFEAVRIDVDQPYAATLRKQYPIDGVPTIMVFSPEGKLLNKMSGEPTSAEAFMQTVNSLAGLQQAM